MNTVVKLEVISPLKDFGSLEDVFDDNQETVYASELWNSLGYHHYNYKEVVDRSRKVCEVLKISVGQNFRQTFRYNGTEMFSDWKLSKFARYLVLINGDPSNPVVAEAQVKLIQYIVKN